MRKFKQFLKLGIHNQLLFVQTFFLSGFFRFLMVYAPFKYLKKYMGVAKTESAKKVPDMYYEEARRIQRIVLLVCNYTPWQSKCLVRALLVQYFLKRKGIATTIYFGVNKDEESQMMAHAWIRCGEMIVMGEYEKDHFIQVAQFSNEVYINEGDESCEKMGKTTN